jgi:hypothetical protein
LASGDLLTPRKEVAGMKKQVNTHNYERISSRMAKEFGVIEKNLEGNYEQILFHIESNLLKINRKHGIDNGQMAIDAIHICLLMIDGYLNRTEYDLDPYITETNKPFLTALLMSFDPFTNEHLKPIVEEKCDMQSTEGLHEYFEAPVKCLLWIEKNIELQTKNSGNNGYFSFLENQIGEAVAQDETIDCIVVTWTKESATSQQASITMQDVFPGMTLQEILLELFPAVSEIFKLGFIPSPLEIHEITQEEYAAYQSKGGDISKPLYTIIPKNYKYLDTSNEIILLTIEDTVKLGKAVVFLHLYAKESGCESQKSDDILNFAAKRFPAYFSKDTKFERPPMKILEPGELPLSERDEIVDLLAHVVGEGITLNMKVTYQDTNETKEITLPIEKKR